MTVQELIQELAKYPPTMEVIVTVHSDYGKVEAGRMGITRGIYREGVDYVQAVYGQLNDSNEVKDYLHLGGF